MGQSPLLPGAWIGVIGGGQLGRMLVMEARRMGYHTYVLDPDPESPAAQLSNDCIAADYADTEAAKQLARRCDVVTYEFENVNADAVAAAESVGVVHPSSRVLRIAQHRLREKGALAELGFPVPTFHPVTSKRDMVEAVERVGYPSVLKTATSGYDGKGQAVLHNEDEAVHAYERLRPMSEALILEKFVAFEKEMSVICARDANGCMRHFPAVENIHRSGILDTTIAPARVSNDVASAAVEMVSSITEKLDVVGLLAVELFLTEDDRLLVNELAPRPHNSGHYTLDACVTSQFEQLIRAMCGLPLGDTRLLTPAVMVNLLGDVWEDAGGQPDWASAMAVPGVKLHLYGKKAARPGRKMGHICALADDVDTALECALEARDKASRRR